MKDLNRIYNVIIWARNVIPLEKRNVFVVYALILSATCLDNLNSSSAFTLQSNIEKAFQTSSSTASWVLSGYALTLGSFILVSGKISDIIGPHNFYLVGLALMSLCSLICAVLPTNSIITLIVFRAFQGIGASSLVPSTLSLAANYFSGDHSKYLPGAIVCYIVALTGVFGLGMILGGAFSETNIGYKSYFYFVFAYSAIINIILLFLIIPIEKTKEHKNLKLKNIDFIGASLSIIGLLLVIIGLTEGGNNWRSPKAYITFIVGVFTSSSSLIFEIFYIKPFQKKNQNKHSSEDWRLQIDLLYPPEIINIPNFLILLIVTGLYYTTFTMLSAIGVQYYSLIELNSPVIVGVKIFPISAGLTFGALLYRQSYYNKIGLRKMFIFSGVITLATTIWFSRLDFRKSNSYWKFGFISMFLYGYGINMYFNIYTGVVVSNTPLHLQGVVNGIYQTCSQVLLSIGNALVPSIVGNTQVAATFESKIKLHDKLQIVFYVAMGFHVLILFLMVFFVKEKKQNDTNMVEEIHYLQDATIEKKDEYYCETLVCE